MVKELLAQGLHDVFFGGNWTDVSLRETLSDVTWQEASQTVPFTKNTIVKIVYHLKYSNLIVKERALGKAEQFENETEGFAAPVLNSENDWQQLQTETYRSAEELSAVILNFDEENLYKPILEGFSTAYKNFQGVVEHAHYHLGQIVMIKKYLRQN